MWFAICWSPFACVATYDVQWCSMRWLVVVTEGTVQEAVLTTCGSANVRLAFRSKQSQRWSRWSIAKESKESSSVKSSDWTPVKSKAALFCILDSDTWGSVVILRSCRTVNPLTCTCWACCDVQLLCSRSLRSVTSWRQQQGWCSSATEHTLLRSSVGARSSVI